MKKRRMPALVAGLLLLCPVARGQTAQATSQEGAGGMTPDSWSFSAVVDGYVVPHQEFYASPVFTADRSSLHLEARYNFEDQQTGSAWVGYNFSFGQRLKVDVTPMIGGVFGNTTGAAPGYKFSFAYKRITLSSTGEYVFDTKDHNGSFFYSWPELTYSPTEWLRTGLVAQRTKAYHTTLNVQRGFLVGISHKKLNFTTYILNPGWAKPTLVLEAGADF
jgi:hypothetical protein